MRSEEVIFLVHGYNKSNSDMKFLKKNLEEMGYKISSNTLPILFSSLEKCTQILKKRVDEELNLNKEYKKIHFIGHSMGGIIIRKFLENNRVNNLGRCILIATPNKGMKLADFAEKKVRWFGRIFKPIYDAVSYRMKINRPVNIPEPEIGVIAGNKNNLILGRLLSENSDGRVEVEETKFEGMKEFMVLNYGHKEIHHKSETVIFADNFLQNGKFKL